MSNSSTAQIEANRANSRKSTGPTTADGKAAASRNATSHGLTSREIYVRPGEETDYLSLEDELVNLYNPQNQAGGVFFKILVHSAWNLRRCRQLEVALQIEANEKGIFDPLLDSELGRKADRILRHGRSAERSHSKALAELRKLQTERTYRIVFNPALEEQVDDVSPATEMNKINDQLTRNRKSQAVTATMELRNRYSPGMPAIFDNEDGTFTAWASGDKSTIRFQHGMIVNVAMPARESTRAAALTAPFRSLPLQPSCQD